MVLVRTEMVLNIILLISAAGMAYILEARQTPFSLRVLLGFTSLRIYAIYGMNRFVFLVVLVLGLMNPAISIVSMEAVQSQQDIGLMKSFEVFLHFSHAHAIVLWSLEWLCRLYCHRRYPGLHEVSSRPPCDADRY